MRMEMIHTSAVTRGHCAGASMVKVAAVVAEVAHRSPQLTQTHTASFADLHHPAPRSVNSARPSDGLDSRLARR